MNYFYIVISPAVVPLGGQCIGLIKVFGVYTIFHNDAVFTGSIYTCQYRIGAIQSTGGSSPIRVFRTAVTTGICPVIKRDKSVRKETGSI